MSKIKKITAREIFDSRSNPTIEARVELKDSSFGVFSAPSGISTGRYEAKEVRDGEKRLGGLGVQKNVEVIEDRISKALEGAEAEDQEIIDKKLLELDGTKDKSLLGANTILCVSAGVLKAQANSSKVPVFSHIKSAFKLEKSTGIPRPMFNILNGGKHANFNIDFQEFMVVPKKQSFSQNLEQGVACYQALKAALIREGKSALVGDEGGFAPKLETNEQALDLLRQSAKETGIDVSFAIDVAANSFKKENYYQIEGRQLNAPELMELLIGLTLRFDLESIEDPFGEDDWNDWVSITEKIKTETKIVADDLTTTNTERLSEAIEKKAATAILVKPNQIGTVTETIETVKQAQEAGMTVIVSHRSGETNDDFIADFAVGVNADFVKFGAPARGERISKYNRLLAIEHFSA